MTIQKTRAEILSVAQSIIPKGFIRIYSYVDATDSRLDSYVQFSTYDVDFPATVDGVQIAFYDEFGRLIECIESTVETVTVTPESSVKLPATIKIQLDRLYADNEFCQHEEEIDTLESQLKSVQAASYRTLDGTIVHCSINELAERLDKPVESCPDFWDFSESEPVQKPATKNRVVCTISSKLAKRGVKHPMRAAWSLYNATLRMFHEIASGNVRLAQHIAKQIRTKIYALDNTSIITDFFSPKTAEFIILLAR